MDSRLLLHALALLPFGGLIGAQEPDRPVALQPGTRYTAALDVARLGSQCFGLDLPTDATARPPS